MKQANTEFSYSEQEITQHGLTIDEYRKIIDILGREPNITELGIFSVMWSEHCSYKSTRLHLKNLHTKEDWVICGPGENAGVIDIGEGKAAIFKMESHNHPSFIEPYQGAATGVGGIMRDVFTMGARPIAVLDSLRFGEINHPLTRHLVSGVSAGISGYGNCVGVPNIAGDTLFDKSFNGNILVNAMCIGLAEQDKIFYSAASEVDSVVVYVGSKTGRDGIHGATMASAEFDDESQEKRPTVQVGDPFKEKLLIEACLELMQEDAIIAIQDMGAAGLTSSSLEMAGKGGTGIDIDLDKVPLRETGMTPYEIMLSESQERMLMVLDPNKTSIAEAIFKKWDLDFSIIGKITDNKNLILRQNGKIVANMPVAPLSDDAPIYDRKWVKPQAATSYNFSASDERDLEESLTKIISCADVASKHEIYQQYDFGVMNDTVKAHNIASGIVRIHDSNRALAATTDCTPRYVQANPYQGAMQAVAESYRNVTVLGAKPLAITNCLNFGNPEKPEIMGQIAEAIRGIGDAAKTLQYPVISGNVSLYNETNGEAIQPVPNIGGVGLIDDIDQIVPNYFTDEGEDILIIGETTGHLGRSLYLREVISKEIGDCPPVNLETEKENADFVRNLINQNLVSSLNDVSDGGILTLLTKMTLQEKMGFDCNNPTKLSDTEFFFAEDGARYAIATNQSEKIITLAQEKNIVVTRIGKTVSNKMVANNQNFPLKKLEDLFNQIIKL